MNFSTECKTWRRLPLPTDERSQACSCTLISLEGECANGTYFTWKLMNHILSFFQPRTQGPLSSSLEKVPWFRLVTCLPLSKQLPTRVDSLFFKKRREKRMQFFSNWYEDRGMEVISSLFFKDRDAEKIYSLLSAAFQKLK